MSPLDLGGITSKLSTLLGGGNGKVAAPAKGGYPSTLSLTMGDTPFNTAAKVIALLPADGAKARIWEMTIPGGAWRYRWGFGHPALPDNQGYWWFALVDANVGFCNGIVTLAYESYDRHTYIPIEQKNDNMLNSGIAQPIVIATAALRDKKQMQALPEGGSQGNAAFVQQFSRLVIDYQAIARSTAEDLADFSIPITIYS